MLVENTEIPGLESLESARPALRTVTRSCAGEDRYARYFTERLDNSNERAGTIGFFWSASLTTESGMAEFTRSGRPRLDKERLPPSQPTAMIVSRARHLRRGLLTAPSHYQASPVSRSCAASRVSRQTHMPANARTCGRLNG